MSRARRVVIPMALACVLLAGVAQPLVADERYAVVITGAAGDPKFAAQYDQWRGRLTTALTGRLGFDRSRVFVLSENPGEQGKSATGDNVRGVLVSLAPRVRKTDLLLVVLIGHGTYDGSIAKFNLVGPDLDAGQWASLLQPIRGQVVLVHTGSASFPFLPTLASRGRVVITATDSRAARYDTVFPEHFISALESEATDRDRNNRLSVWEVFTAAAAGVKRHYEQKGLLPVEHALLDDAGDGLGKTAEQPGVDVSIAQAMFLGADPATLAFDEATRELMARRDELLGDIEALKKKKRSMEAADYWSQMETLLVEVAKVSRALRAKGVTAPTP